MKICVIRPSLFGKPSRTAMEPLLFAILKALTPPDVELVFYDENIASLPEKIDCDAAALTADSFTARRAYIIAERFKKRGIPIIMGGYHSTLCPDEALQHADAVCIGDAEDTWGDIMNDLKAGRLKQRYVSGNHLPLDELRFDRSVFHKKNNGGKYAPIGFIQFSRGCRFRCDFCSIHAFYGGSVRTRPIADVIASIRETPHKLIFFTDDNLFSDIASAAELIDALKPLKKRWICQVSVDIAKDFSLLKRMRESGCIMAIVGFESLNLENLRRMGKTANLAANIPTVIQNLKRAGILIYGTFVIGYDADNAQTAMELARFANQNGFAIANFNPLIPTPGTALYERLQAENRLLMDAWWNDPGYRYGDTTFIPIGMSPEELAASCREARFSFYSIKSIFKRIFATPIAQWPLFLAANLISRGEIHRKQGRRLADENSVDPPEHRAQGA